MFNGSKYLNVLGGYLDPIHAFSVIVAVSVICSICICSSTAYADGGNSYGWTSILAPSEAGRVMIQDIMEFSYDPGSPSETITYATDYDSDNNLIAGGRFNATVDFDPGTSTVSSTSGTFADAFIAKYSPTGSLLWRVTFGAERIDSVNDVKVDASGNIYAVGQFRGTVDFDPSPSTNILTAASGLAAYDMFIAKFSPAGQLLWVSRNGISLQANEFGVLGTVGTAVEIDSAGNIWALATRYDLYNLRTQLYKYSPTGSLLLNLTWINSWGFDLAKAPGKIYVVGAFRGLFNLNPSAGADMVSQGTEIGEGSFDGYIVALANDGSYSWGREIMDLAAFDPLVTYGYGVTVDSSNNIYVSGDVYSYAYAGPLSGYPFDHYYNMDASLYSKSFLVSYTSSGTKRWSITYGSANELYWGVGLETCATLHLYSRPTISPDGDIFIPGLNIEVNPPPDSIYSFKINRFNSEGGIDDVYKLQCQLPRQVSFSPSGDMGFGGRIAPPIFGYCNISPDHQEVIYPAISQGFVTQYKSYVLNRYPLTVHVSKPLGDSVAGMGFTLAIAEGNTENFVVDHTGNFAIANLLWGSRYSISTSPLVGYPAVVIDGTYDRVALRASTNLELTARVPLSGQITTNDSSPISGVILSDPILGTRTTDADGRYIWQDTPLGHSFTMTVNKPGYAFLHPYFEGTTGVDGTRSTIGTLMKVTLGVSIPPIPYDVTITPDNHQFDPLVIQAGESRTSVTNLPWGSSITLLANSTHYSLTPNPIAVLMDGDKNVSFTSAILKTYQLTGQVMSSSGSLSDVLINAGALGQLQTDATGHFAMSVQALQDYALSLSKSGYYINPSIATGRMTSNIDLLFSYQPECHVTGRVLFGSTPLSGVTLPAYGYGTGHSDLNGYFNVSVPCNLNVTIRPSLGGYTFSPALIEVIPSPAGMNVNIAATRTNTISGVVFLENRGLSGVAINYGGNNFAQTDQTGGYSVTNVADGTSYTLVPSLSGYVFSPPAATGQLDMPRVHNFTATRATYFLKGTVTTEAGTPLPGVAISSGTGLTTTSNISGNFIFPALVHGLNYELFFSLRGYRFSPAVVRGQLLSNTTVNVHAIEDKVNEQGYRTLSGFVYGITGPVSGVNVQVNSLTPVITDADGRFSYSLEQGSAYSVTLNKSGYIISPHSFTGTLTDDTSLTVNALSQCSLSGSVLLEGEGLQNVSLSNSGNVLGTTDSLGNFALELACGQTYQLTPARAGYSFSPTSISGQISEPTTAVFNATGKVSLRGVVSIAGIPANGIVVDAGTLGTTTTDSYGQYSFDNLPRYTYYSLRVAKDGVTFSPQSNNGQLLISTNVDFAGTWKTYILRGKVLVDGLTPLGNVRVTMNNGTFVLTNETGDFAFSPTIYGTSYTISFSKEGYSFSPSTISGKLQASIFVKINAAAQDSDKDGVTDAQELSFGTDPTKADTDNDGALDGQEQTDGSSPLDPGSHKAILGNTICSEWNGFLGGMMNVMEHVSVGKTRVKWTTQLYNSAGVLGSTGNYVIPIGSQYDIIANQLNGFAYNSYGRLCSRLTEGEPGSIDGRMVYYKTDATGNYQFAVAMPFSNGEPGKQFVEWNTIQPSINTADNANIINNWIQITNLGTANEKGNVTIYTDKGSVLWTGGVSINSGGRVDIQAHRKAQALGLALWKPVSKNTRFLVRNMRYYYDNSIGAESFSSAYQIEARPGNSQKLFAPFDTTEGKSVLDIGNTAAVEMASSVKIYSRTGKLLKSLTIKLAPQSTYSINLKKYAVGQSGMVEVYASKLPGIVAVITQASLDANGSLINALAIPAAEPLGTELKGSYNTFLSQTCKLVLINSNDNAATFELSMRSSTGAIPLRGYKAQIPPKGSFELMLSDKAASNTYGTVSVVQKTPHSLVGQIIRIGNNASYRIVTPMR